MCYSLEIMTIMLITQGREACYIALEVNNHVSIYKIFSFTEIQIWNCISRSVDCNLSYLCFKRILQNYIKSNDLNSHLM